MARHNKVGKWATTVTIDVMPFYLAVKYHDTNVVTVTGSRVRLNSDGWRTLTTKTRMNQAANEFGLKFHVYQKNHDWYVRLDYPASTDPAGPVVPFVDGMEFDIGAHFATYPEK